MHPAARRMLIRLFVSWQRHPETSRTLSLPINEVRVPEYTAVTAIEERDEIHATLKTAERAGAIHLVWGRYEYANDLKIVRLADGQALAVFLGETPAAERLEKLSCTMRTRLQAAPAWLTSCFSEAQEKWRRGQSAFGLKVTDPMEIQQLFEALLLVHEGRHEGLDLRTFSARYLDHSKVMETIKSRFAAVWAATHDLEGLSPDDVFQSLGLEKFPQPVLFRGPLQLRQVGRPGEAPFELDYGGHYPYAAFAPQAIENMAFSRPPAYCLTIENFTSFNRHVSEIVDDGIVLYTGGFPAPQIQHILRWLDRLLPAQVPCWHWGDMDVGGLLIFRVVAESFAEHRVRAHLMSETQLATARPHAPAFTAGEVSRLRELVTSEAVGELAALLADRMPWKLEQEVVDPQRPAA